MGELRNKLERKGSLRWNGLTGFQIAALIWAWVDSEERPARDFFGNPHWFQTRAALVRKGIINKDTPPRKLTTKGIKICKQLVDAFPDVVAEAKAERKNRGQKSAHSKQKSSGL